MRISLVQCVIPESSGFNHQTGNLLCRILVAVVALWGTANWSIAQQDEIPRGVFSLSTSGKPCSDTVLANPDVVGVAIRYPWFDLEPTEGDFGFDDLKVVFVAGDFVAVGATVKRNDVAGGGLSAAATEEDVVFECGTGEPALVEAAHLSVDVVLESANLGDFEGCLSVILVLELEAPEEGFDEFNFAVR